ncbi:hypothetical protein Tco_0946856, partial [Tanacetum coccineum]
CVSSHVKVLPDFEFNQRVLVVLSDFESNWRWFFRRYGGSRRYLRSESVALVVVSGDIVVLVLVVVSDDMVVVALDLE